MDQILHAQGVTVSLFGSREPVNLVADADFDLVPGTITALVGESGAGKTTLGFALTRLFRRPELYGITGSVVLDGVDLLTLDEAALRQVRRTMVRTLFQEPSQAFHPLLTIGRQLFDALPPVNGSPDALREEVFTALRAAGFDDPPGILESFPHEASTGMLARIQLAGALAAHPGFLVADEPTAALDPPLQYQLLDMLRTAALERHIGVLLITHDLHIARAYAGWIHVMYAGMIVETASMAEWFAAPRHPYAQLLQESMKTAAAVQYPDPPSPAHLPPGCSFHPRCPRAQSACGITRPALSRYPNNAAVRCPYWM